jgi:hypothetical protein
MLSALLREEAISAVKACVGVRELLQRRGIPYGGEAVRQAMELRKDGQFRATILQVAHPVVSGDGTHALLASSVGAGPEAGVGSLEHLMLQPNGRWIHVGSLSLWIA